MKRIVVVVALLALALSVLALAGCGGNEVPAGAIAAVGDGVVTQEQFNEILEQAKAQYEAAPNAPDFPKDGTPEFDQLKGSIVSYLVTNELIAQRAADEGVSVSDKELQERIKQIQKQYGQKQFDKLLKQQGVTLEQVEQQLEAQMLQDKMRQKVNDEVKISDEKLKAYFDDPENKAQFEQPETVEARHILVKTKAEADKVRALLVADDSDANWKKVAKQYSTDPGSKESGGSLGAFPRGRMVPEFEKVAFTIDQNTVSEPVKSQFGWHVIETTKKTEASARTFEESKEQIKQMLLFQEQAKAWEDWLKQAREDAGIVYAAGFDPDKLTAAPSPAGSPAPAESPAE